MTEKDTFDFIDFEHDRLDKTGQFTDRQIRDKAGETHHPPDIERREASRKSEVKPSKRPKRRSFTPKHEITDEMAEEGQDRIADEAESLDLSPEQREINARGIKAAKALFKESDRAKLQQKVEASTKGVMQDD